MAYRDRARVASAAAEKEKARLAFANRASEFLVGRE